MEFKAIHDKRRCMLGAVPVEGGVHFSVVCQGEEVNLLLFQDNGRKPAARIPFSSQDKVGDVWNLTLLGDFQNFTYCYEMDGKLAEDPYGQSFCGRETWGSVKNAEKILRAGLKKEEYDWEGDQAPEIPFEECIFYRLHPRGFTRHSSSGVKNRGTFSGIQEKIPYLLELGVTTLEILPSVEFQEVMMPHKADVSPYVKAQEEKPSGKVNYWGFVPGLYFAPKASYCSGGENTPAAEFKDLVKALHREGLELVMDLFFTGEETESFVLDVLRFWVMEYHVDGFNLIGFAPVRTLGRDPYLSRVKLLAQSWDQVPGGKHRHLAEYNEGFAIAMKRFLKGDEGMINSLIHYTRRNPGDCAVINYMANVNGFTLMDNVSYDQKHNEANGEHNQDGTDYNYSWNCGVEGPTRKKRVLEMRRKLIRNAVLLTFLSQGTPLLLAGDEFGNSQSGNNNPYCQDNEISWLNWNLVKSNEKLLEFVKAVIRFRKDHPVFHFAKEPQNMDYRSLGMPDVSYHGEKAWKPEFEQFRRQLGILYCGPYGKKKDGSPDDYFFVAYNMHWEPHEFALPNLPKTMRWFVAVNTDAKEVNGIYPQGEELFLERQKQFMVPPRSILVFMGKEWTAPEEEKKVSSAGPRRRKAEGGKAAKEPSQETEKEA